MIKTLQSSKLRKYLLVRLCDLLSTQRTGYRFSWSTRLGAFRFQTPSFRVGWLTSMVLFWRALRRMRDMADSFNSTQPAMQRRHSQIVAILNTGGQLSVAKKGIVALKSASFQWCPRLDGATHRHILTLYTFMKGSGNDHQHCLHQ